MTLNQIKFQEHKENVRHNRASEGETERTHRANESIGWSNLTETQRHNRDQELTNLWNAQRQAEHWKRQDDASIQKLTNDLIMHDSDQRRADYWMKAWTMPFEQEKLDVEKVQKYTAALANVASAVKNFTSAFSGGPSAAPVTVTGLH